MPIGPLGIGGVIDEAIGLALRHFRPLFVAMLLLQAPALALARLVSAQTPGFLLASTDPGLAAARAPTFLAAAGLLLFTLFLMQSVALTITAAVLAPALQPEAAPRAPPSRWRQVVAAAATGLVQQLILLLSTGLGLLPGLLLALYDALRADRRVVHAL
jgi:hypothetical protein